MHLEVRDNDELGYTLIAEIGSGAFGTVYLATKNIDNQDVAIKMISYTNQKSLKDFIRETDLLADLTSDASRCQLFIPCIYERFIYRDDVGNPYLTVVMKYVKGYGLDEFLDEINIIGEPIREDLIVNFMWWIYKAICFIHSKGIVHRDIKPANIILELETGNLMLVDFGLGCNTRTLPPSPTACEGTKGTRTYMSPEMWLNDDYTFEMLMAHDVWSATIIFYELAHPSHRNPFREGTRTLNELIDKITDPNKNIPSVGNDEFDEIIKSGLDNNYQERPLACILYNKLNELKNPVGT